MRSDLADWSGAAAAAYQRWAVHREQTLRALARASETMTLITEAAGTLIGTSACWSATRWRRWCPG